MSFTAQKDAEEEKSKHNHIEYFFALKKYFGYFIKLNFLNIF